MSLAPDFSSASNIAEYPQSCSRSTFFLLIKTKLVYCQTMQSYKFHSNKAWAYNLVSAELAEAHNTELGPAVEGRVLIAIKSCFFVFQTI